MLASMLAALALAAPQAIPPAGCTTTVAAPAKRAKTVEVRMACNHRVGFVRLRTTKGIAAVGEPVLDGAEPRDFLSCIRAGRRRGRCDGSFGTQAVMRVPVTLTRRACGDRPLRVRVETSGGMDCEPGTACPAIGYATDRTVRVSGC